jgi:uncharacterized protein YlxW (UPF0749 family)
MTTGTTRRPDESMTLLNEVMRRPLDPGYQAAARRRVARGETPMTGWSSRTLAVAMFLVGLLFTIAVVARNTDRPAVTRVKDTLIGQINAGRATAQQRSDRISNLQSEISRAQAAVGGVDQSGLAALESATAAIPVHGPAFVVTLDDAPDSSGGANGDPRGTDDPTEGRVLSRDVQVVVNALWGAGAEAVAINGQRLSPRSAIRFAGDAILVNFRPLTRPYVITAIGAPDHLENAFMSGAGGEYLRTLSDNFGIVTSTAGKEDVRLPGATNLTVRESRPATSGKAEQ